MEDRKVTLLKACMELLKLQEHSNETLYLLGEEIEYDGCYCDGYCLLQDIKNELEEN